MKDYTPYLSLARQATKQYDITVTDIAFLCEETNIFFTLNTKTDKYVLKVFQEESSKLEDNLIEAILLKEVTTKTDIVVPSILPSKTGEEILFIESDLFDEVKRVAVYKYIDGKHIDGLENSDIFFKLGATMAKLHQATKEITLPNNLQPKRWDKVYYYRDEVPVYQEEKYRHNFTDEERELYTKFIEYLDKKLPSYYKDDTFLLHADLNPWNVLLHNNELRVLDFEEGMSGSVLHEMAICLFYYRYDPNFVYKEVQSQLYDGYRSIEPLQELQDFDIDLLIMARTANFVNYVLLLEENPKDYIKQRIKRIKQFLDNNDIKL